MHACLSCRAIPDGDVSIVLRADEIRQTNTFLSAAPVQDRQP